MCGIHAELRLHELRAGGDLGGEAHSAASPAGGSIGMSAAPRKNAALPATSRPVGSLPSSRSRRAVSISVFEVDVEHRLGVGLIAGLGVVAGEQQNVVNVERRRAHQFALQRDAVLVAAGDLQDRLDAGVDQERRRGERAHVGAGAGAIGDIDRVGEPAQRRRLAQQILRVAGHRRGDLRRHDKTARPQPLGKVAGQGGAIASFMCKLALQARGENESAYMLSACSAIARCPTLFWTRNTASR